MRELRGDRQVYTPQMVVNGSMHVLGSDRAAIERVIAQTDRNTAIMSLPVLVSVGGGDLTVTIKPVRRTSSLAAKSGSVRSSTAIAVAIGRGENRGRTVTYHNVVRGWRKLGDFDGTDSTWTVPLAQIEERRDRCRRGHGAGGHAR